MINKGSKFLKYQIKLIFFYIPYAFSGGFMFLFIQESIIPSLGFQVPTDRFIFIIAVLSLATSFYFIVNFLNRNHYDLKMHRHAEIWTFFAAIILILIGINPI